MNSESLWTSYSPQDIPPPVLHIPLVVTADLWDMVKEKQKYIENVKRHTKLYANITYDNID